MQRPVPAVTDRLKFGSALEAGELLEKDQWNLAYRPVALFCDDQLSFSGHLLFSVFVHLVILCADKKSDDICVLFDRTRLPQVTSGAASHCRAIRVAGSIEQSR